MRRREFITRLSGIAAAWLLPTKAQQPERRRIGVLWPYIEADTDSQSRVASLRQALQDLGWTEGRNLRFDYRFGASADNPDRIRRYAAELVALAPDVIVAGSGGIAIELRRTSRTIPIVFPTANDPVGVGLVESLERPGGNATGFSGFESGQTEKFLELLKQIAPNVMRVAVIRNPTRGGGTAMFAAIPAARCRCDRAWCRCLRWGAEWRVGRAACRIGDNSPRRDHQACDLVPFACGIPLAHIRHRRWFDVVRACHDRPI